MSSSDISSLSSAESIETDDEILLSNPRGGTLDDYFKNAKAASPPTKKKRSNSPTHEYVLADNSDIAFIVMFRARFNSAFPKSIPQFGPQDIERGVVNTLPDEGVEKLLCALIGLVLNRKKDVERGHHTRALEEAVLTNSNQWPPAWENKNPLHGGGNFNNMSPTQRLTFLKTLILWALNSSEAIQTILKDSYKQQRHEDDLNQPLSVQPWGRDGEKRRYWLIEGQDDTHFRLYRESNPALKHNTWWSIADSIDSIKGVASNLRDEGSQASRKLSDRITQAIPRFEAGEDKRKRRDYRLARKAQFRRPDPGFSLYEGRTRGKRIRYTFSDEEDGGSDEHSTRRSIRQSGVSTPAENTGPTFTASGRQVKYRVGGAYGETMHSGQNDNRQILNSSNKDHNEVKEAFFRTRSGGGEASTSNSRRIHIDGYNSLDELEDESDAISSGNEWDGGDDDDDDDEKLGDDDEDEEMSEDEIETDDNGGSSKQSLLVSLRYQKGKGSTTPGLTTDGTSPAGSTIVLNDVRQTPDEQLIDGSGREQKVRRIMPEGPCQDLLDRQMKPPVEDYSPTMMQLDPSPLV